ncbi:MAG: protein translocase subunit SecF [Patescibacteria group bacterium]
MINFLKYRFLYFLISLVVIGTGLFFVFRFGIPLSIDFAGGSNISYSVNNEVSNLRTDALSEKEEKELRETIDSESNGEAKILLFETVGPSVGRETVNKMIVATALGVLAILAYIGFAFKGFNFALAAIVALFHDLLVLIGVYAILSYYFHAEIDLLFITAALTTMSFSVHDTIVIFDKIREYIREEGSKNIEISANRALTETMVRSLNNSMTIIFMLLALILFGGSTIKFFIISLLIGTITGTYSSPFIATPFLVWIEKRKQK